MGEHDNPWITRSATEGPPTEAVPGPETSAVTGPQSPQAGIPIPQGSDRLPRRAFTSPADLWWVGTHGGAGESTLARLSPGSVPTHHSWPMAASIGWPEPAKVVLVARTHASGLRSAQLAATEWASGAVSGIELIGLVLIADAPGRMPRPLKDLVKITTGGVPRTWHIPWIEGWRLGDPENAASCPKVVRSLVSDINSILH